ASSISSRNIREIKPASTTARRKAGKHKSCSQSKTPESNGIYPATGKIRIVTPKAITNNIANQNSGSDTQIKELERNIRLTAIYLFITAKIAAGTAMSNIRNRDTAIKLNVGPK